jgi:hypothetical protein
MDHVRNEYAGDMEVDEYYAAYESYEYQDPTNNSGNWLNFWHIHENVCIFSKMRNNAFSFFVFGTIL